MITQRPMVFIVNGNTHMRERLRAAVTQDGLDAVLFASATQYLAAQLPQLSACLVADLILPDMSGLELQRRVAATRPIVFWSYDADLSSAIHAVKAGAVDVLSASASDTDILRAVHIALDQDRASRLDRERLASLNQRFSILTSREREVLKLVVSGLMNKQVAAKLGISQITVKSHRRRIMQKMVARSFADLVRMAGQLETSPVQLEKTCVSRASGFMHDAVAVALA
jgi:RNA polymerase sigma factor (sigma-70 family)